MFFLSYSLAVFFVTMLVCMFLVAAAVDRPAS